MDKIHLAYILPCTIIATVILYTILTFCYRRFCVRKLIHYNVPDDEEHGVYYDPSESSLQNQIDQHAPDIRNQHAPDICNQHEVHISDSPDGNIKTHQQTVNKTSNSLFRKQKLSWPNWIQIIKVKKTETRVSTNTSNFPTFRPGETSILCEPNVHMEQNPLAKMNHREVDSGKYISVFDYSSSEGASEASQYATQNIQQASVRVHNAFESAHDSNPCDHQDYLIPMSSSTDDHCYVDVCSKLSLSTDNLNYRNASQRKSNNLSKSVDLLFEKSEVNSDSCRSLEKNFVLTSAYKESNCVSMYNLCSHYCSTDELQANKHHYKDTCGYRDSVTPPPNLELSSCQKLGSELEFEDMYVPMNPVPSKLFSVTIKESNYMNTKLMKKSSKRKASHMGRGTYIGLASAPTSLQKIKPCLSDSNEQI